MAKEKGRNELSRKVKCKKVCQQFLMSSPTLIQSQALFFQNFRLQSWRIRFKRVYLKMLCLTKGNFQLMLIIQQQSTPRSVWDWAFELLQKELKNFTNCSNTKATPQSIHTFRNLSHADCTNFIVICNVPIVS